MSARGSTGLSLMARAVRAVRRRCVCLLSMLGQPRNSSPTVSASEPLTYPQLALLVRRAARSVLNGERLDDASQWKAGAPTVFLSAVIKDKLSSKRVGKARKRGRVRAMGKRVLRALRWGGAPRSCRLGEWLPRRWSGGLWEWVGIGHA